MGHNQAIGGGGFHHIALRTADFEKSVAFYTEVLGFSEKVRWGEGDGRAIMLDTGDGNYVEIFAGGKAAPEVDANAQGAFFHVAYRSDDVDAATERARAAGYEVTIEPKNAQLGEYEVRISFFKGPDGEIIELFQTTSSSKL